MPTAYLMASKPGAYTREGLILGNPESVKNAFTPQATTWNAVPDLTFVPAFEKRLLSIVTDSRLEVMQCSAGETPATITDGVATTVPAPTSGNTSYSCFLHPATTAVYVRTP